MYVTHETFSCVFWTILIGFHKKDEIEVYCSSAPNELQEEGSTPCGIWNLAIEVTVCSLVIIATAIFIPV